MQDSEDISFLFELLQSIVDIPHNEWLWLCSHLDRKTFKPSEELFFPGTMNADIHFIHHGLVRYYYCNDEGEERNHTFASDGNLVACFPVIAGAGPCTFTIEALENTKTLLIDGQAVKEFATRHTCWAELQRKLFAHVALRKAAREEELLLASPEQRYRSFLSNFGALAARIPQYHIASYIGVTPVGLSRIRKRINLG